MGGKKQKETTKIWVKAVIAMACVFFALVMVLSAMGTGWLSFFTVIRSGDTVTIDYTIRDGNGNPLVTTDQQVYKSVAGSGSGIFFSKQLVIQANQSFFQTTGHPGKPELNEGSHPDPGLFRAERMVQNLRPFWRGI